MIAALAWAVLCACGVAAAFGGVRRAGSFWMSLLAVVCMLFLGADAWRGLESVRDALAAMAEGASPSGAVTTSWWTLGALAIVALKSNAWVFGR